MNEMTEKHCQRCGKQLSPDVLGGLCPACLMTVGESATTAGMGKSFEPPPLAELGRLFPALEIIELLGRGGMGAVYKARQPKLDRYVALKLLTRVQHPKISEAEFAARFQQEARALARLAHPDIVAVHDFGEAGGYHYLLMEYVEGVNLRQLLRTQRLSPEQALKIVPEICEALQFAHERGIVHRDIKPENILLDKEGRVKIADFGIAKIVGVSEGKFSLTGAKDVLGTPHYMAPEQVEHPQTVDHRADIYSLGVVFYEMLTGELPLGKFQPPSRACGKVQIDVRLDEVVLHALEKEPDHRYQHVSEVRSAVETIATTPSPQATTADSSTMTRRYQVLRWKSSFFFFAAACLFVATGLIGLRGESIVATYLSLMGCVGFNIAGYRHLRGAQQLDAAMRASQPAAKIVSGVRRPLVPTGLTAILVGTRGGERVINWPGVIEVWLLISVVIGFVVFGLGQVLDLRPFIWESCALALAFGAIVVGGGVVRSLSVPEDNLTPLDDTGSGAAKATANAQPKRGGAWKVAVAVLIALAIAVGTLLLAMFLPVISRMYNRARTHAEIRSVTTHSYEPASNSAASFGPVIERVVNDISTGRDCFVNLETGELVYTTEKLTKWEEMLTWSKEHDADVVADEDGYAGGQRGLTLLDGLTAAPFVGNKPADESYWKEATAESVVKTIQETEASMAKQPARLPFSKMRADKKSTPSFILKTRQGRMGILQILALTDNPRGVKIRYKLVNQAADTNEWATLFAGFGQRNVTKASRGRYEVKLPNGVQVKVVAVAGSPRLTNVWWHPYGGVLASPPADRFRFDGDLPDRFKPENEVLLLAEHSLPDQKSRKNSQAEEESVSIQHEYFPSAAYSAGAVSLYWDRALLPNPAQALAFRELPETLAYHCGVSIGPWERVAELDGRKGRVLVQDASVTFTLETNSSLPKSLAIRHNLDRENYHIRVVAHLRDGKTQVLSVDKPDTRDAFITYRVSTAQLEDLEKITLERRRCYWAEIADIMLLPRSADSPSSGFGPVIERVVNEIGVGRNCFLNLETGELLSTTRKTGFITDPKWHWTVGWYTDLVVYSDIDGERKMGLSTLGGFAAGPNWDDATIDSVVKTAKKIVLPGIRAYKNSAPSFIFKTQHGRVGILQILTVTDYPPGTNLRTNDPPPSVKIRYKLVEGVALESWPPKPVSPQSHSFGPVIERTVQQFSKGHDSFLDLDTGGLLTPPKNINQAFATQELRSGYFSGDVWSWLWKSGADLMTEPMPGTNTEFSLKAVGVEVRNRPDVEFDRVESAFILDQFPRAPDPWFLMALRTSCR